MTRGPASVYAELDTALDAFTRTGALQAEHRRLMDAHHRSIDWSASTASELSDGLRSGLAELWRARMVAEHRSVGIFALYALDLLGAGAPAEVLSLACRAALDEVRHAELFARLASLYSGHPETPPPGIPPMPDDPSVPIGHQVAREALHLSVCAETYSAVLLAELHARARDPVVRDVLAVVIADEIYHARMGWAFIAQRIAPGSADSTAVRSALQDELGPMFEGFVEDSFGDPRQLPPPSVSAAEWPLAEAHGYLSRQDEWALFRATITDVWLPGLRRLGFDAESLAYRWGDTSAEGA